MWIFFVKLDEKRAFLLEIIEELEELEERVSFAIELMKTDANVSPRAFCLTWVIQNKKQEAAAVQEWWATSWERWEGKGGQIFRHSLAFRIWNFHSTTKVSILLVPLLPSNWQDCRRCNATDIGWLYALESLRLSISSFFFFFFQLHRFRQAKFEKLVLWGQIRVESWSLEVIKLRRGREEKEETKVWT